MRSSQQATDGSINGLLQMFLTAFSVLLPLKTQYFNLKKTLHLHFIRLSAQTSYQGELVAGVFNSGRH